MSLGLANGNPRIQATSAGFFVDDAHGFKTFDKIEAVACLQERFALHVAKTHCVEYRGLFHVYPLMVEMMSLALFCEKKMRPLLCQCSIVPLLYCPRQQKSCFVDTTSTLTRSPERVMYSPGVVISVGNGTNGANQPAVFTRRPSW